MAQKHRGECFRKVSVSMYEIAVGTGGKKGITLYEAYTFFPLNIITLNRKPHGSTENVRHLNFRIRIQRATIHATTFNNICF